ncbi:hypothetical protein GCM10025858_10430 [Alicyclobacillus sacchari]|nr:hypothetical protein GCM10025858_10430 [Alicyclobacillus sacchari]
MWMEVERTQIKMKGIVTTCPIRENTHPKQHSEQPPPHAAAPSATNNPYYSITTNGRLQTLRSTLTMAHLGAYITTSPQEEENR